MTKQEKKLVTKQLHEANKFKDNVVTYWLKSIANELIDRIHLILVRNPSDVKLETSENKIQDLIDIFEGMHKKVYEHKGDYDLFCTKYNEDQEPFNHLVYIHNILDKISGLITK